MVCILLKVDWKWTENDFDKPTLTTTDVNDKLIGLFIGRFYRCMSQFYIFSCISHGSGALFVDKIFQSRFKAMGVLYIYM